MRLFVALPVPNDVVDALLPLQEGVGAADWTEPDDLHLTLRFLGEWPAARLDELRAGLDRLVAHDFVLGLRGVGCFPPRGAPHALWAGVSDSEPLRQLQRRVDQLVAELGGGHDPRHFAPHITLGRLRGASDKRTEREVASWLQTHSAFAGPVFAAGRVVLYQSGLAEGGGGYLALHEVALTASADTDAAREIGPNSTR